MRFNLITNFNGVGLEQDARLLAALLEERGHDVALVQWNRPEAPARAHVNVFLELVVPRLFDYAAEQWLVPNPEWHFPQWPMNRFTRVLAKTRDAEKIFSGMVGERCHYIGWRARDLYRPTVAREKRFLHVAGKSRFKNTEAVIAGCRLAGVDVTVVSEFFGDRQRVTDDELVHLFNSHRFFLCPSAYEGFGQALHEALGCGAVVITTDAAPMNEIAPAVLIPTSGARPHHLGTLHSVTPEAVRDAVRYVLDFNDQQIEIWEQRARHAYQAEVCRFHEAMDAFAAEAVCA